MQLSLLQLALGILCGGGIGFILALAGGGGSILAVPMMIYVIGVPNPHVAIGTSAFAVAANTVGGLLGHAKARTVRWRSGMLFASSGVAGALIGSTFGKLFDGQRLVLVFACLMLIVASFMLFRCRTLRKEQGARPAGKRWGHLIGYGIGSGGLAGFFGIGGGFLIVPGLLKATGMSTLEAIGTSLIVVLAFGLTTAANYAWSGLVLWPLAGAFVLGGIAGSCGGGSLARRIGGQAGRLDLVLAGLIFTVATAMIAHAFIFNS